MTSGRRLLVLLTVVALIGAPAVVLRLFCVGNACPSASSAGNASVPFCPLPADLRTLVQNGFYANQGRSPDVFSIAKQANISGGTGTETTGAAPVWPDLAAGRTTAGTPTTTTAVPPVTQVPIVFSGAGVSRSAQVPAGTGLDDIAPTIATAIGQPREHPELRAGKPIPGVAAPHPSPRLILEVIWAGIGSIPPGSSGTPFVHSLLKQGAGTLQGTTGSLPVDSTAALTTIGTGGLPYQHGIPGSVLRNGNGELVGAWSKGAPISVLPTIGDDLTNRTNGKALLGLVAPDTLARGIVGGDWYPATPDQAQITFAKGKAETAASATFLAQGFGKDDTPDILAVVLPRTGFSALDAQTKTIVTAAEHATGGSTMVVVAGTGDSGEFMKTNYVSGDEVVRQVEQSLHAPVVSEAVPGGLFLNQDVLASKGITAGKVVAALAAVHAPADTSAGPSAGPGPPLMDQAFPAFSITFARYC